MSMIIERAFIMALLTSIGGFVFCMIFLPFEKFISRLVSAKTMVNANMVSLLSFVIPFYFVISIIDGTEAVLTNGELIIYQDIGGYDSFVCQIRGHICTEYFGFVWLAGALLVLLYYLWRYFQLLNMVKRQSFCICDDIWSVKFYEMKKQSQISNVYLVGSCCISTPCTIGVRNKYIVIPSYMINVFDEEEIEFILKHEFYHVKNEDFLRNLLIMFLGCLNWFNPLYYFLRKNLSEWIEIACDEEVTKNYSNEQRHRYCRLIIKVLELEGSGKGAFAVRFGGLDTKNYRNRIMKIIKHNRTSSKTGKITIVSLIATALLCGTAAAKEADMSVHSLFSKNIYIANASEISIVEYDEARLEDVFLNDIAENMNGYEKDVFVNDEGVTCTIIYNENVSDVQEIPENQVKHVHKYADVIIKEHRKNADGSCVSEYYEGRKCINCDEAEKGDRIGKEMSVKCPH